MKIASFDLRRFLLTIVVISTSAFASSANSTADEALKSILQTRYAAMKAAMAVHDDAAIRAIITPNFESIDTSGQSATGPQMIAEVRRLQTDPNKASATTLLSISRTGDKAVVEQRYVMKTKRASSDGVMHNIELVTLSTDTWLKQAGVWFMERTVTDSLSVFRDGALTVRKTKTQ